MKIGIFTVLYGEKPLEEVARYVSSLGYEAVELLAWKDSTHFDLNACLSDTGYAGKLKSMLDGYGLQISALNNAMAGQLVLGSDDPATDSWTPYKSPNERAKFGMEEMKKTAQAAAELGVPVVTGFVGSQVWNSWYIWP